MPYLDTKTKRWLLTGLGILVLSGLLAHSIRTNPRWQGFDWGTFLDSLLNVDKIWAGWALVTIYATYVVRVLRWRLLMSPMKPHARFWNLFSATVIGFGAIGVLGRAGEMVRPYLVARKEAVPLSSQLAVWLVERCFDTLTLLVTAAFALRKFQAAGLRTSPTLSYVLHRGGDIVAFSLIGLLILMAALRNFADPIAARIIERLHRASPKIVSLHTRAKIEHAILAFVEGARGIRAFRTLGGCILYSVAEWVLIAFCYKAVFNSFSGGLRLEMTETLIFMGGVMLGSMINIPGIGGGIQVASLLVLTEIFGIRPEPAAGISLLIWFFTFLAVVPPAVLLMLYEGLSWTKLRRLESEN